MRSLFAALTVLAVSAPALALDAPRDLAKHPGAQVAPEQEKKQRGNSASNKSASNKSAANKIQDRIPHNVQLRLASLPDFFRAPQPAAPRGAYAWGESLDAQIARHAAINGVPLELARRVVKRESGGNPRAVSKGNYGLMQIRLGTAQAMGYKGGAQGLLDADTNMTYAMKYLAGALRAANGNHDRAVALYARGYYPEAKRMGFSPYEPPRAAGLMPTTATR